MKATFYFLLFLTIVTNIGVGLIMPIMPILMKDFGFTTGGLSVAFFALVFSRFIFQNVGGNLISKIGSYKVLAICFFLYIVIMGFYPFVLTKEIFVLFRFLEGVFQGFAIVCLQDLAIEHSSHADRGKKMGYFSAAFGLGFIIGPSLGGLMYQSFDKYGMFWSAAVLTAIGFLGIVITRKALNLQYAKETVKRGFFVNFSPESLFFLLLYGPQFLRRILFFSFQILLPLYLYEHLNVPAARVGFYFTLSAILTTSLMPVVGRAADKISCQNILIICLLAMTGFIALFGFVHTPKLFTTLFILETLAFCFMLPTGMKIFGDAVAFNPNRGRILGFYASLAELCTIPIPFIVLPLYKIAVQLPWIFLGSLCLIVSLPFWNQKIACKAKTETGS